jgi:hypothetical protein
MLNGVDFPNGADFIFCESDFSVVSTSLHSKGVT